MRPPSRRIRDNGTGVDVVTTYKVGIDPEADADEEGNWVKAPRTPVDYEAVVCPSFATGQEGNGTDMSLVVYSIMICSTADPGVKPQDDLTYRGKTLVAQGCTAANGPGAWIVQAIDFGPNPDTSGLPDGVDG